MTSQQVQLSSRTEMLLLCGWFEGNVDFSPSRGYKKAVAASCHETGISSALDLKFP